MIAAEDIQDQVLIIAALDIYRKESRMWPCVKRQWETIADGDEGSVVTERSESVALHENRPDYVHLQPQLYGDARSKTGSLSAL